MTFNQVFGNAFHKTFSDISVIVTPWYLSGGIAPANCVAAYQAKGAASYAVSKSNLANPGTYDLAEGSAPSWSTASGWTFNGVNNYLKTGIMPTRNQTWSMAIRYSGETWTSSGEWETLVGSFSDTGGNSGFLFHGWGWIPHMRGIWTGGGEIEGSTILPATGVFILTGKQGYLDGVADIVAPDGVLTGTHNELYLGGLNYNGVLIQKMSGNIIAVSIYNTSINFTQVGLLTTAMNAL